MFFGLIQVLHLVGKQAYKLELLTNWRIYDFSYMWLLEQNKTWKRWVNKLLKLGSEQKLGVKDN